MTKKNLTIISVVLVLVAVVSSAWYLSFIAPKKLVAEKCHGFVPNWADFVDCHGMISINDGWDMDYLSLKDHVHKYEIARVDNQNQYIYENNKIFVINRKAIENSSTNGTKTIYYQELFQNGRLSDNPYGEISDIPTFLVVETISGEVEAYKNITDVPIGQQGYFTEINIR